MNDQQTFMDTATQPTPPGSAPALAPQQSPLSQAVSDYTGKMDTLFQDQQKEFAASQEAQAPYRAKILQMLESPNQAQAHLQKVQEQPKPQDYQKYSMEFASAMAVMGALAGRWTRQGGTTALNAFAGALKGWQSGNLQAYENASKEWEQATKKTLENNRMEIEKYREIMADKKANIDQMMAAMNIVATEHQNKLMFDATMAKNYTMAFGAVDKMVSAQERVTQSSDRLLGFRSEDLQAGDSRVKYFTEHPEQLAAVPMQSYLALKGWADTHGRDLPERPASGMETNTLDQMVERRLAGDKSVLQNIGRGIQGAANVQAFNNRLAEVMQERGISGADLAKIDQQYVGGTSYQRATGNQAARIETASNEVSKLIPQALETSRSLPRGKWVPVNTIIQQYQKGSSDPAYNDFALANFSLLNAYTRAMNPQGVPRIQDRLEAHAIGLLSMATDQKAYEVQVNRLWKEVQASKQAVSETRQGVSGGDINAPVPQPGGGNDGWGDVQVK